MYLFTHFRPVLHEIVVFFSNVVVFFFEVLTRRWGSVYEFLGDGGDRVSFVSISLEDLVTIRNK